MLITRIATASVLLALFVSALYFLPNAWWTALLLPVLLAASWEWTALTGMKGGSRGTFAAIVLASALGIWLIVATATPRGGQPTSAEILIYGASGAFWLFIAVPWLARGWLVQSPLLLAATGWILLVPTWLALTRLQPEPGRLLAVMGIIWLADIAAYFSGRTWGRHQLAPGISPGKTWEGVAGAVVAVTVYYVVLGNVARDWTGLQSAGGAALFAGVLLMSVVGDLFESWIKRQAGMKDSGTLLPGHGGILDRIDSMTSSLPLAALLLPFLG
jgi:phosphatidate cytidylyltransferase